MISSYALKRDIIFKYLKKKDPSPFETIHCITVSDVFTLTLGELY